MDYNKYTASEINSLNNTPTWIGSHIKIEDKKKNTEQKYVLHATGHADMNGRKYIALPSKCDVSDPTIKRKYNLMW
jgi:hypothetical protein